MRGLKNFFTILFMVAIVTQFLVALEIPKSEKVKAVGEPAWSEDLSSWQYRKKIHIDGTDSSVDVSNVMKLNLHHGNQQGDVSNQDIFLNDKGQTDFDDVRFTDADGNPIDYWRASYDNSELINDDKNVGESNIIINSEPTDSNTGLHLGDIIASGSIDFDKNGTEDSGVFKSSNNGVTWTRIYSSASTLGFVDSRGYIYIHPDVPSSYGGNIYRSTNGGTDWAVSAYGDPPQDLFGTHGSINWSSMTEDSNHNVYIGQYTDNGTNDARIFRSEDQGATFQLIYSYNDVHNPGSNCTTADANCQQHVHGMSYDPYENKLWAGMDGALALEYCDLDDSDCGSSADWAVANTGFTGNDYIDMVFDPNYQLFAAGGGGMQTAGNTVVKHTGSNIATGWSRPLSSYQTPQAMKKVGDSIYGFVSSYNTSKYPQIIKSDDDGDTWKTVYLYDHRAEGDWEGSRSVFASGTPKISEGVYDDTQLFVGVTNGDYPDSRLYVGGDHYESTFYIIPGSIEAAGKDIYVYYGNDDATTEGSKDNVFSKNIGVSDPNLQGLWQMDEGADQTVITDSTGHYNGTLGDATPPIWDSTGDGTQFAQSNEIVNGANVPVRPDGKHIDFTSGYVSLNNNSPVYNYTSNFSIFSWVKIDVNNSTEKTIFAKGYGSHRQYVLSVTHTLRFTYTLTHPASGSDYTQTAQYSALPIDNSTWHFVGVTVSPRLANGEIYPDYDGADAGTTPGEAADACSDANGCQYVTFWIDGQKEQTNLMANSDPAYGTVCSVCSIIHYDNLTDGKSNPPVKIGSMAITGTANFVNTPFVGAIDSVRIYNDVPSDKEILSIYEGRNIPDDEPAFDGATNNTAISSSQNKLFKNVTNTIEPGLVTYNDEPQASDEINMTIAPSAGSIDASISEWNTGAGGDYSKTWTETGDTADATADHTIGGLAPSTYYTVSNGGSWTRNIQTNGSGVLSFTYDGGYSSHTFTLNSYSLPVLTEITPVKTYSKINNPSVVIHSNKENAVVTASGDCVPVGNQTVFTNGNNTVTFKPMSEGLHNNCTMKISDGSIDSELLELSPFTVDITPPTLTISSPNDGASTSGSSITIVGSVADANPGATLTINDVNVPNPANFSITGTLTTGTNLFIMVATDAAGNETTKTITITKRAIATNTESTTSSSTTTSTNPTTTTTSSTAPTVVVSTAAPETATVIPSFVVLNPSDKTSTDVTTDTTAVINTQKPVLRGKTTPFATVTIEIHSNPITATVTADKDGWWEYKVNQVLELGKHTVKITIKAKDTATAISENTYSIHIAKAETAPGESKANNNFIWYYIAGALAIILIIAITLFIRKIRPQKID